MSGELDYVATMDDVPNDPRCTGCGCEGGHAFSELSDIGECCLTPGDASPAGRCPLSGDLCYPVDSAERLTDRETAECIRDRNAALDARTMNRREFSFYRTCVDWPRNDVHAEGGLCAMIDAERSITRRTFMAHVNREDRQSVECGLGYAPHDQSAVLTMASDFHVSYHRSKLHGQTVYYFKHSAIEYVFTKDGRHDHDTSNS